MAVRVVVSESSGSESAPGASSSTTGCTIDVGDDWDMPTFIALLRFLYSDSFAPIEQLLRQVQLQLQLQAHGQPSPHRQSASTSSASAGVSGSTGVVGGGESGSGSGGGGGGYYSYPGLNPRVSMLQNVLAISHRWSMLILLLMLLLFGAVGMK